MKKLFIIVGCISQILFSCHKNHDPTHLTRKKPELTNPGDKKLSIKVSDVYSKLYAIKRRIEFINKNTNAVLGKMFITLSCNDPRDNLYKKLYYEPEKFSGQITLESRPLFEFTKRILNGQQVKVEKLTGKDVHENSNSGLDLNPEPDPDLNITPDPGISMDFRCPIFDLPALGTCAKNYFSDMYWLDYALCAVKGNFCIKQAIGVCESVCK